jgi:hypothetical protein
MGYAYTPGLKVLAATTLRRERRLPLAGDVLVSVGDKVRAEQVTMRTELPGPADMLNVVSMLGISPGELGQFMLKSVGDSVQRGEMVAQSSGFFGLFKTRVESPMSGTIEAVSPVTGQVTLRGAPVPVEVHAYIDGTVVETVSRESVTVATQGTFIQGIFGVGGETYGTIALCVDRPDMPLDPAALSTKHAGAIVVAGSRVTIDAIRKAQAEGVRAIVAGGCDDADLKQLLGYDLGVAITGHEDIGITVILTEGFGEIPMAGKTFELLQHCDGMKASVNGATQIRAGVMRPEIIIPLDTDRISAREDEVALILEIGARVRAIRHPYFGKLGVVTALPAELIELPTGSRARVLSVKFDDGAEAIVPRANVEVIATVAGSTHGTY